MRAARIPEPAYPRNPSGWMRTADMNMRARRLLYGSITALVVAILSLGRLALILRSKELKWR
jgi:hypothetical protein